MDRNNTWVEIQQRAILSNVSALQTLAPHAHCVAMIKCNAYGHGLEDVARILERTGVTHLGVESVDEALRLRKIKVKKKILIISSSSRASLEEVLVTNSEQVVYDLETLSSMLSIAKRKRKRFCVHLKIDTGMSRQGVFDVAPFAQFFKKHDQHVSCVGVLTHFADADTWHDNAFTNTQLKRFHAAVESIAALGVTPKYIHACNTAGVMRFAGEKKFTNTVRFGIGIYGLFPSRDVREHIRCDLRSALAWKTRVMQVKNVPSGTSVGYNRTETVARVTKIAVLPIGYYHGIPRAYSSKGYVLIHGVRCKVLGRISMNSCAVDVTDVKRNVRLDDPVVLIGRQGKNTITADEFASVCGTINYEIVTRINPLIPRVIV